MTTLSDRQAAFVREYMVDLAQVDAAIRAGYSPRSASVTAARLMKDPRIQAEICRRKALLEATSEIRASTKRPKPAPAKPAANPGAKSAASKAAAKPVAPPKPAVKAKAPTPKTSAPKPKTAPRKAAAKPKADPAPEVPAESVADRIGRLMDGTFAPGNRLWEIRSSAGPEPTFEDPAELWRACVEYFEWAHKNPLLEAKTFPTKDEVRVDILPRLRALTITGLCLFLDVSQETWRGWKTEDHKLHRTDLVGIIKRAEAVIYEQKLTAASVGLLNPNLIAREMGLADKVETTGKDGAPIEHSHKVQARVVMVPPKKAASVEVRDMPSEVDG